jgi:hypothetical protein
MYANEVLSEVEEGAAEVNLGHLEQNRGHTGLCIVLHFDATQIFQYGKRDGLYTRCRRVSV